MFHIVRTSKDQAALYRLTGDDFLFFFSDLLKNLKSYILGDLNPLHIDPRAAEKFNLRSGFNIYMAKLTV